MQRIRRTEPYVNDRTSAGQFLPGLADIITELDQTELSSWWPGPTYRSPDGQQHCVLAHVESVWGPAAMDEFEEHYSTIFRIGQINDGPTAEYPQDHPKDRVLAFLHAMDQGAEMTTTESMDQQYVATTKIYVAGPMTGYENFNYQAFDDAATRLRALGYSVLSPSEIEGDEGAGSRTWDWYMRRALTMLLQCDAVAVLPGWQESKGAVIETELAKKLGMQVEEEPHYLQFTGERPVSSNA